MRALEQAAVKDIEAVLTAAQKQQAPTLLKELNTLRETGIPLELYGDLKLTTSQKQKLAAIATAAREAMRSKMDAARQSGDFGGLRDAMEQSRRTTNEKAHAVLTTSQQETLDAFLQAHPRPRPGDGNGPPNGRGGQPGGPPPPDDGNGPPPPPPGE